MRRYAGSFLTAVALAIVLWMIWSKLRIVLLVRMPWWGLLIMGVLLFLAVDYILDRLFRRDSS